MLRQAEEKYGTLLREGAIAENTAVQSHLKWQKAVNDLALSKALLRISTEKPLRDSLRFSSETFFDWVIVSSYYSIFHAAQALLGIKKVKIMERMHYATLIAFAKHYISNHELAEELFLLYENAEQKAQELLSILEDEKRKRGIFQYHRLSRNNIDPAKESVENAKTFLKAVEEILSKKRII